MGEDILTPMGTSRSSSQTLATSSDISDAQLLVVAAVIALPGIARLALSDVVVSAARRGSSPGLGRLLIAASIPNALFGRASTGYWHNAVKTSMRHDMQMADKWKKRLNRSQR